MPGVRMHKQKQKQKQKQNPLSDGRGKGSANRGGWHIPCLIRPAASYSLSSWIFTSRLADRPAWPTLLAKSWLFAACGPSAPASAPPSFARSSLKWGALVREARTNSIDVPRPKAIGASLVLWPCSLLTQGQMQVTRPDRGLSGRCYLVRRISLISPSAVLSLADS
jgi:hypothetical protein